MPFRLSQPLQDRILYLRLHSFLNLKSIAEKVGTSRGTVQRVCESEGLNDIGRHGKGRGKRARLKNQRKDAHPEKEYVLRKSLISYRSGAKRRGYVFDLTFDQFVSIVQSPCEYCGLPSRLVVFYGKGAYINGIDRTDSKVGYTVDNCVPCCNICNFAKKDLSLEQFKKWIVRLVEHNRNKIPA
jgi:hypothetical protein